MSPVLSLEEQGREMIAKMRQEAEQTLRLCDDVEEAIGAGHQGFITAGDELVGFAFPKDEQWLREQTESQ